MVIIGKVGTVIPVTIRRSGVLPVLMILARTLLLIMQMTFVTLLVVLTGLTIFVVTRVTVRQRVLRANLLMSLPSRPIKSPVIPQFRVLPRKLLCRLKSVMMKLLFHSALRRTPITETPAVRTKRLGDLMIPGTSVSRRNILNKSSLR